MGLVNELLSRVGTGRLFGGRKEDPLEVLEEAISLLRLSTFYTLQKCYLTDMGYDAANALAVAVVSKMVLESPVNDRFSRFCDKNADIIREKVSEAHRHDQISGSAGCASYLYAAEILHSLLVKASYIPDATKTWKADHALQKQAARLGIFVPTGKDICGSNNKVELIHAIRSYAKAFYYTNTWMATGKSHLPAEGPLPEIRYDSDFINSVLLALPQLGEEPSLPQEANSAGIHRGLQVALDFE